MEPDTGGLQAGRFWLQDGVIGCACPDCGAPMSVRLWLMMADCPQCGCSIELSEEDQRQIDQLLGQVRQAAPARPKKKPEQPLPEAQPEPPTKRKRNWLAALLAMTPAWLVSAVFHMVVILLLGLITLGPEKEPRKFILASRVSDVENPNDWDQPVEIVEDTPFEESDNKEVQEVAEELVAEAAESPTAETDTPPEVEIPVVDLAVAMTQSMQPKAGSVGFLDGRGETSRARLVQAYGGTTASEAAVAKGLKWLADNQNEDGSWSLHKFGARVHCDASATGLAVLPFLGAGQTHKSGRYRQTVAKALYWLREHQKPDGRFEVTEGTLYGQGICTLAMTEAYYLTKDESLRKPAEQAVDYICKAQHKQGGWRYRPNEFGDTSVMGWQLMALHSARWAYIRVPQDVIAKSTDYLNSASRSIGGSLNVGYGYQPGRPATITMTAEGLLCRVLNGMPFESPEIQDGAKLLAKDENLPRSANENIYYYYYATQFMHHVGGPSWHRWNNIMRDYLIRTQVGRGKDTGSWEPDKAWGDEGGRIYQTSLSLLTLEVYYRHLPLYQHAAQNAQTIITEDGPGQAGGQTEPEPEEFDPLTGAKVD